MDWAKVQIFNFPDAPATAPTRNCFSNRIPAKSAKNSRYSSIFAPKPLKSDLSFAVVTSPQKAPSAVGEIWPESLLKLEKFSRPRPKTAKTRPQTANNRPQSACFLTQQQLLDSEVNVPLQSDSAQLSEMAQGYLSPQLPAKKPPRNYCYSPAIFRQKAADNIRKAGARNEPNIGKSMTIQPLRKPSIPSHVVPPPKRMTEVEVQSTVDNILQCNDEATRLIEELRMSFEKSRTQTKNRKIAEYKLMQQIPD